MFKLRRPDLHLFYWTTRLVILLVFPAYISDVGIYQIDMMKLFDHGQWPYRDFSFEYPPLTFLLLAIPTYFQRLFHLGLVDGYRFFLGLELLPFDLALFLGFLRHPPIPRAAFYYIGLTCLLPFLLFDRMDLVVAASFALPFLWEREAGDWGFVASWGLGGAFKLIPTLFVPLAAWGKPRSLGERAKFLAAGGLPVFLSIVFVFFLSDHEVSFLTFHGNRGVQVESFLGNLALSAQALGWLPGVGVETAYRSQQVTGVPGLIETAKILFWAVFGFSALWLGWQYYRARASRIVVTWLVLLGMITFAYVLSPQYMLWLIPLALLVAPHFSRGRRRVFLSYFFLLTLMTGLHFVFYWSYANRHFDSLIFLLARNLLLAGFWALNWIWLGKGSAAIHPAFGPKS